MAKADDESMAREQSKRYLDACTRCGTGAPG